VGYTKLFESIVRSSVWDLDSDTTKVWVTMMALANADGVVESSIPGLAHESRVPLAKTEAALTTFLSPDSYSSSPEYEGRRIEQADGGWRLLNYDKYAEKLSKEEQREKARVRKARQRGRDVSRDVTRCHAPSRDVTDVTTPDQTRPDQTRPDATAPRDPTTPTPTTYQDDCRELERRRTAKPDKEPKPPPYPSEVACTECDSGPMQLRPSKFADGCGWYYRCIVCDATRDAEAVEKRRAYLAKGKGQQQELPPPRCAGCSEPALPGGEFCAKCKAISEGRA